jgi:peptidoglycan/LPS O-acetylase OafA/YrhL
MSQTNVRKAYLTELEMVRAFGIIAVIMIHATSFAVVDSDPNTVLYLIMLSLNTLSQFAVPFFIMISGLSLFYNYYDKPLNIKTVKDFYMKRITKIMLPFLIFSFIYYAVFIYYRHDFTSFDQFSSYFLSRDFLIKLIIGKTYAHMYFIFIVIQCYLLFPLIWYVLRKWSSTVKWMIAAGLVIQWLYLFNAQDMGIKYVASGCFAYSLYFCIGAYIGINYTKLQQNGKRTLRNTLWRLALFVLCVISGATRVYTILSDAQGKMVIIQPWVTELENEIYVTTACLLLIQLALWLKASRFEFLKKMLVHLGIASFGVYLLHPLFLKYYRMMDVSGEPLVYGAWIAGGFFLALLGSWIIVTWTGKVKGHWVLFGPISHKK